MPLTRRIPYSAKLHERRRRSDLGAPLFLFNHNSPPSTWARNLRRRSGSLSSSIFLPFRILGAWEEEEEEEEAPVCPRLYPFGGENSEILANVQF